MRQTISHSINRRAKGNKSRKLMFLALYCGLILVSFVLFAGMIHLIGQVADQKQEDSENMMGEKPSHVGEGIDRSFGVTSVVRRKYIERSNTEWLDKIRKRKEVRDHGQQELDQRQQEQPDVQIPEQQHGKTLAERLGPLVSSSDSNMKKLIPNKTPNFIARAVPKHREELLSKLNLANIQPIVENLPASSPSQQQQQQHQYVYTASPTVKPHSLDGGWTTTKDDPDGLLQRKENRWRRATCHDQPQPPKLSAASPIIPPKSKDRPYMGVLVDAGRSYFPMDWLFGLVDFLAALGYDWIHFRLTDDQSFVAKLDCHPELAISADPHQPDNVYTSAQLKEFVSYAKERQIQVMPEINVPSHAGAWSGVPELLLPCSTFICQKGYAIPLNVTNPRVLEVVGSIIREVRDIFSTAPYIHLGGDELWMSNSCFSELQTKPNFQLFEDQLQRLLEKEGITSDMVIRWEETDTPRHVLSFQSLKTLLDQNHTDRKAVKRTGNLLHYWNSNPTGDAIPPFVISSDLYFDTSKDKSSWDFYATTMGHMSYNPQPIAVIAGTFELGPCTWDIRNVWGKLLAVAMAAASRTTVLPADIGQMRTMQGTYRSEYQTICREIGLPDKTCLLDAMPAVPTDKWIESHQLLQLAWLATVCDRLTYAKREVGMKVRDGTSNNSPDVHTSIAMDRAKDFRHRQALSEKSVRFTEATPLYQHVYKHTGVMIDLAHHYFTKKKVYEIIDVISRLGFNLLHLRLVENEFFPLFFLENPSFQFPADPAGKVYDMVQLREIVEYAASQGVAVYPEINVLSQAGGWANSGLLAQCPNYICEVGGPLPMDVRKGKVISVLTVTISDLLQTFSTAPFFHLGSSDWESSEECYKEAYPLASSNLENDVRNFEQIIGNVLVEMGLAENRIIRWESDRKDILGSITHYLQTTPIPGYVAGPFLMTADVAMDVIGDDGAWEIYQHTRQGFNSDAMGVIVGTNGMGAKTWDHQNILGRLVAVAAALSTENEMDESTFKTHYESFCRKARVSLSTCGLYGKPKTESSEWEKEKEQQETEWKALSCRSFTNKAVVARHPRRAIFG